MLTHTHRHTTCSLSCKFHWLPHKLSNTHTAVIFPFSPWNRTYFSLPLVHNWMLLCVVLFIRAHAAEEGLASFRHWQTQLENRSHPAPRLHHRPCDAVSSLSCPGGLSPCQQGHQLLFEHTSVVHGTFLPTGTWVCRAWLLVLSVQWCCRSTTGRFRCSWWAKW